MKVEIGRVEISARWLDPRYEIQVMNEHEHLVGYSGPPYLMKAEAIKRARVQPLPRGHTLVVRHVGNGGVAYKRSSPPACGTAPASTSQTGGTPPAP